MKRLLVFLIMLVLISGGIVGILYLNQGETDDVNMVTRAEAIAMAEKAAEKARLEASTQVPEPEEPKEEVVSEPAPKPKPKPAPAPATPKRQFYRYTVKTQKGRLHLREKPNGKILDKVPSGTTGYVIEKNDGWSVIEYDDTIYYASSNFLVMEEIAKKDFPKKYRKLTAADVGRRID